MEFRDFFSSQAKEYSIYRPKYPPELFQYLASLVKEQNLAWDSATGNGQAAGGLANYFKKVIATDASESQISHAEPNEKIEYRVATAENGGLESTSADLITVATAIHWINTDKFYKEVKRIAKPHGIIAVWTYSETMITPEIDALMKDYSEVIIGRYWPPENIIAWNFEELAPFPFVRFKTPEFKLELEWNLQDFLNYLYTWSATQNYIRNTGINPLEQLYKQIIKLWGDENEKLMIKWDMIIKAGKI